jgi:hypothetical protein
LFLSKQATTIINVIAKFMIENIKVASCMLLYFVVTNFYSIRGRAGYWKYSCISIPN